MKEEKTEIEKLYILINSYNSLLKGSKKENDVIFNKLKKELELVTIDVFLSENCLFSLLKEKQYNSMPDFLLDKINSFSHSFFEFNNKDFDFLSCNLNDFVTKQNNLNAEFVDYQKIKRTINKKSSCFLISDSIIDLIINYIFENALIKNTLLEKSFSISNNFYFSVEFIKCQEYKESFVDIVKNFKKYINHPKIGSEIIKMELRMLLEKSFLKDYKGIYIIDENKNKGIKLINSF